jgi:polyhydroxyalkanoate synthesis regulator phasin
LSQAILRNLAGASQAYASEWIQMANIMKGAIMSIRKRLAVGAATATLGVVLGATVLSPVVAGAQESTTTTTANESTSPDGIDRTVRADRVRESLEDLVTDGTITAAQADAVAEHLAQFGPGPGHGHFRRHIAISLEIAAETIGIERSALVEALADGQTIAEIAADNGTNAGAVIDALVAAHEAKLDELVTDGSITAEEAAERAAEAADRIADLVDGEIEFRQGFGPRPDIAEPDVTEGA